MEAWACASMSTTKSTFVVLVSGPGAQVPFTTVNGKRHSLTSWLIGRHERLREGNPPSKEVIVSSGRSSAIRGIRRSIVASSRVSTDHVQNRGPLIEQTIAEANSIVVNTGDKIGLLTNPEGN